MKTGRINNIFLDKSEILYSKVRYIHHDGGLRNNIMNIEFICIT